jgi:purine-cytosine permease-like protein
MIPRFFWTILCFVIYTVAGVAGREHFSAILSNFLSILSYWTAFFIVIVAEEHFIFRRKNGALGGYNLDDWDSPKRQVYHEVLLMSYGTNRALDSLLALLAFSLACLV